MTPTGYRFGQFVLRPSERRLLAGSNAVDLNSRYLDALVLLVEEQGRLVSKDRFLDEVWRGVPVTDEALTQCIKTLRRQLGDDAARPTFIETVPKHGYRFIAEVEADSAPALGLTKEASAPARGLDWHRFLLLGGAGTTGGFLAGIIGGLFYGFAGASQPLGPGIGAASVLLVLLLVTAMLALVGAAGVSFGIAAASRLSSPWTIAGGAAGGLIVGAVVKLVGLDAFNLLFGQSPGDITGAPEGALLGAAVGLASWFTATRGYSPRRAMVAAAPVGAVAGLLITLLGGRIMGGSLDLLARHFPTSRLRLDQLSTALGEPTFGPISLAVTATLEATLFTACITGALTVAQRR